MPPRSAASETTGRAQANSARIGASRENNLPSTISASDRSVVAICARMPRARSWQSAPAVAAGATSSTIASWMPASA